jgi:hypothetical protein
VLAGTPVGGVVLTKIAPCTTVGLTRPVSGRTVTMRLGEIDEKMISRFVNYASYYKMALSDAPGVANIASIKTID